MSYWSRSS